ncbi:cysteine desulfurase [Candidatus Gracilibacteria bacterium]|nr:MAG: cysteine desulfurase [Candidatus Gracilibacteria bacterium]PIE85063.1 MAG: cysteine desulfurase [Candidatus Gracilibacteria bacterium]
MNIKSDFPIFKNNPGLVYMDSTATSQKPSYVIEGIKQYLENYYSNIHRGSYDLSEKSELLYEESKKVIAKSIGASSWREIIYSFNSTYASNLFIYSLKRSNILKSGDKVLLSMVEHHANIVPWLILQEDLGIEIDYVGLNDDYSLNFDDLKKKLTPNVKLVSFTHVSNITGEIFDLKRVGKILDKQNERPLFLVDASQSIPHMKVDVKDLGCDAMFFTGHKVMADSGIGVLWGKEELLKKLKPIFSGGGAISWVKKDSFKEAGLPDKFEPGTPNLTGAVSLLRAFEYLENIGGYEKVLEIEKELNVEVIKKFSNIKGVKLIGGINPSSRVSVFSFVVEGIHSHDIADYLADNNICIRAGQHCAEPYMRELGLNHTCRMSLYIYNTLEDVNKFFEVLEKAIKILK